MLQANSPNSFSGPFTAAMSRCTKQVRKILNSAHPETAFMAVILRSKATKNLIIIGSAEILRFAQNDIEEFPDGN